MLDAHGLEAVLVPLVVLPRHVVGPEEAKLPVAGGVLGVAPVVGVPLNGIESGRLPAVDLAQDRALALSDDLRHRLDLPEPVSVHVVLRPGLGEKSILVQRVEPLQLLADARYVVRRPPVPAAGLGILQALVSPVLHDVVEAAYLPNADLARVSADVHDLPGMLERAARLLPNGSAHPVGNRLEQNLAAALACAGDRARRSVRGYRRPYVAAEEVHERRRRHRHRSLGHQIGKAGDLALSRHAEGYPEPEGPKRPAFEGAAVAVLAATLALVAFVGSLDA